MEMIVYKDLTVSQLTHIFSENYPLLKIEIYHCGEEMSHDCFHTLHEISNMKNPQNFTILPEMSFSNIEEIFWEKLGLQVVVFRKIRNEWVPTSVMGNYTLEHQNQVTEGVF